ncbi:hypothetical protein Tdes44962_MAKER06006, partial [Teratosphaeria destructans]
MDTNADPQKKRKLPPLSTKVQSRKRRKINALDTTKAPITVPSIPTGRSLDNLLPSILEQRVFSKDIRQAPMGFISSRATLWKKRRTPEAATTKQQRPPRFPEKGTYYTHRNDGINWRGQRRYIMKFRIIQWNCPATDTTVEQGVGLKMPSNHSRAGSKRRFSTLTPIPEDQAFPAPSQEPGSEPELPRLPEGHSLDYTLPTIIAAHHDRPSRKRQKFPYSPLLHATAPQAGDEIVISPRAFRDYNSYAITLEEKVYVDADGVRWQAMEIAQPWIFRNLVPDYQSHGQEEAMRALKEDGEPVSPRTMPGSSRPERQLGRRDEDHGVVAARLRTFRFHSFAAELARDLSQGAESASAVDEEIAHPFLPGMLAIYHGRPIKMAS